MNKFDHVRGSVQYRNHGCHWPGCAAQVPPAMWGCKPHWYSLPATIRNAIWSAYRAGQEKDGIVSRAYIDAARAAQEWIKNRKPKTP